MIQEAYHPGSQEPTLVDYVEGLFAPREASDRLQDMAVREVASALEAYSRIEGEDVIETESLAFLASSAVQALGREDLAVEAVIMGTGAVYSQSLQSVGADIVWVINTERLFPDISACTELGFFSVVYHLVGSMVHLWDKKQGRGALGLKRLRRVSELFAGEKNRKSDVWINKIIGAVEARLHQCSMDRGWEAIPRVIMLD